MKRTFLIHGWGGHPNHGWKPWLKRELQNRGFKVLVPAMPNTETPSLQKWLSHLGKITGNVSSNDFFVGHSLGCITILRFLEALKTASKIGGTILVAGFSSDLSYAGYKGEVSEFFQKPLNWLEIKKHCSQFVAIHSDNDPYVPLSHGYIFKEKLDAELIIEHNMKHFSGDDNVFELPVVLKTILRMSK